MVSDIIVGAIIGGVIALLGASLGLLGEPVRAHFARNAHQEQLRRVLYGELFIKLERVLKGYALDYNVAIRSNDINYLKSANKLEIAGLIEFPSEVEAQTQYYQLTSQEFYVLAPAYYRLRGVINLVHKFNSTSFDNIGDAKDENTALKKRLEFAIYFINKAFEDNSRFLEKIDGGVLLQAWRKLMQDFPEYLPPGTSERNKEKKKRSRLDRLRVQ